MKKFRKLFAGILCLSAGVLSLVSCIDEDPAPFQVLVDVMIQDMKTDEGIKYGVVIYASSNYEIKSAKVTGPGTNGKVYQLTATASKYQYVFKPVSGDYTAALPVKGDYTFEVISTTDEKLTGKDVVGDEKLTPIVVKTATMASHALKTTWDKVTGAEAYVIKLYSADKSELLFSSTFLPSDKYDYEFNSSTPGWASGKSPVNGTNYTVELIGVRSETGAVDKSNNLQFLTLDSKTVKWE